jgi:hypothetical protein
MPKSGLFLAHMPIISVFELGHNKKMLAGAWGLKSCQLGGRKRALSYKELAALGINAN